MAETKTKTAQKAAPKSTAAAKPATAKKTVSNAALADAPAKTAKPATKRATTKKSAASWNPGNEERYNMIQVAAYYLAERDNFSGSPVEYWVAAEAQISSMLPQAAR